MPLPEIKQVAEAYDILRPKPTVPASTYHNNLWDIANRAALDYLKVERGFNEQTIRHFQLGANEKGDIAMPIYKDGELVNYKFRNIKEKIYYRVQGCETWIINEEGLAAAAREKYLICVEGEFDAMALWQLGFDNVISTIGGAQDKGMEWIARIPPEVEKVYINYDNDDPGKTGARELAERIGIEKCFNVVLQEKDANDFLRNGGTLENYKKILKDSHQFGVEDVDKVVAAIERLRANPIQRVPTHLRRFNTHTKGGVVKNGLVTISARPGVGKSSLMLNFLIHHADNGIPCLLVSLENDMILTVQRILEIKYRTPINKFTDETWDKAKSELLDYPLYVDMSMQTNTIPKLDKLVKQARKLYGIEIVGFDHVGFITTRKDDLPEVAKRLHEIKTENSVTMYIISHVRKGERDQKFVTADDLYGTAAFHQLSNMVLMLQNFGKGMDLSIEKSRESRSHLHIPLLFNGETGEMLDDNDRKVRFFNEEIEDNEVLNPFVVPTTIDEIQAKPTGIPHEEDYGYIE